MLERCLGFRRARQFHRFFRHCNVTFFCFLLTILVLRGTIGAGKFGTPHQDFLLLRRLSSHSKTTSFKHLPQFPKNNRPRVLLVTGSSSSPNPCENPNYLLKSIKNKVDYCRLHGIEVLYNVTLLNAEMKGFWAKLPLIREILMGHPEVEFLWWMDSDAVFTDMGFELPWERYVGYDLVIHGWREMVLEQKNWVGLNTGSFLVRNSQWSIELLDSWAVMGTKEKIRVGGDDDQSAMVYLLAEEKERWGGRVYLESGYYLHGYEEMMKDDHRWPLVTHFVGCKPCGKLGDYHAERCLRQMDRAFSFGDNQVVKMYGFGHKTLSSREVRRTKNDTLSQ